MEAEVIEGKEETSSGLAKRVVMALAVWERGERARFLRGRLERGSAEVGIDSGICSDIVVWWLRVLC